MKILVLGGHGFFGKSLVKVLSNTEHQIIALSRRDGLDLIDYNLTKEVFQKVQPDVIYNCAAHVGGLHYVSARHGTIVHDNILMCLNLYKATQFACPSALIINPLSNCSYQGEAEIYTESQWLEKDVHQSVYSYGNAKRVLYMISRCYASEFGIKTHNFLIPNAFGPGDSTDPNKVHALNGMIIRMILAQVEGQTEFEIWGTGVPVREWIYVDDVAELFKRALKLNLDLTYPVNLAQQKGYSIRESAELIAKAIGFKGELVFRTDYQDGAPKKILDAQQFRQVFPSYNFMDHYEGICKTVEYYKSQLLVPNLLT
ncbi:MAG: NAD-dependent epimerase/dehydratase family protein [Nostocaceae cyanobacterium]|nr:NAD-dependent epimerase/dehydratase family protein [Nostocaceae cyanobacterium]